MLRRLILTLALTLLFGGFTLADDLVASGPYFFDSAGQAYTKETVDNGHWVWSACQYRWVWYPKVTTTYKPVKLNLNSPTFEQDALAIVAAREKANERLALLDKLGLGAPNSTTPRFGGYGPQRYGNVQLGSFGAQGNSLYGYSLSQVMDLYNKDDPVIKWQAASAMIRDVNANQKDGFNMFFEALTRDGDNRSKFAEILAQGLAVDKASEGVGKALVAARAAPQAHVETKVDGAPVPAVMPKVDLPQPAAITRQIAPKAVAECVACHSGAKAAGGLDLSKGLTADQYLAVINRVTTKEDAKHMPRNKDGSAGRQLSAAEIKDLLP